MMNLSAPFIARPVATTLLTAGILLAGLLGFLKLPVAPLPRVEFPTIQVSAQENTWVLLDWETLARDLPSLHVHLT